MIIIGNGSVITLDAENPVIFQGAVVIEGTHILEVGDTAQMQQKYPNAEFIDASGKVIMPGMINAHTHFYSAFARGMDLKVSAPKNFQEILEKLWWRLDKLLTLEDTYYSGLVSAMECIRQGTTTVIDHHASPNAINGSLERLASACHRVNLRASLAYEVSDRDGLDKAVSGIRENLEFFDQCEKEKPDLVRSCFGLHASFTLSEQTLEKCRVLAGEREIGFHVHVAEALTDRENSIKNYGVPVVKRLARHEMLSPLTIAAHCVHIDQEEVEILRRNQVNVVHNPESNMGNAVGRADIVGMLANGVQVGLGSDGYTADMFESLKVANLIHKHDCEDPRVGSPELATMAFHNNQALAEKLWKQRIGKLKPNWVADVIVLDYQPKTPLTAENYFGHLLMGVSGAMTETVLVNGKLVLKDGEFVTIDAKEVVAKSTEHARKLWQRI